MDLSSRKLSLGRAVLIGLAVLFFATVFVVRIGGDMVDFEVNYRAGERVREGESLYRTSDGHFMFKYLPFAALCYVPISYVPLGAAKALWYGLSVLGAILLFVVSKRIVSGSEPLPPYLAALAPVVLAKFFFREMKLGQINIFVTLLLLWMLIEMLGRTRKESGGALGLRHRGQALWVHLPPLPDRSTKLGRARERDRRPIRGIPAPFGVLWTREKRRRPRRVVPDSFRVDAGPAQNRLAGFSPSGT